MGIEDKKALRRAVRASLAHIGEEEALERSVAICKELEKHIAVSGATVVAMFSPLADEPQIWPLVEQLAQRLSVVFFFFTLLRTPCRGSGAGRSPPWRRPAW